MPRLKVFIATSLDGYIADKDNKIDWLINFPTPVEDPKCGYDNFIKDIGAIFMGRKTFEVCYGFSEWAYADQEVYVFTSNSELKMKKEFHKAHPRVHFVNPSNLAEFVASIPLAPGKVLVIA